MVKSPSGCYIDRGWQPRVAATVAEKDSNNNVCCDSAVMLQGRRGCDFQVADIYWKMVAEGSESRGSSDGGGRSRQQQCWLQLCDMERETAASHTHFDAGYDQSSWQRKIVAAAMKTDGSEGSMLIAFVPQGIVVGYDQGG
ncbi:hypothetical protein BHM03_00055674 [Ensete ventricosum]|nr:hypothetical protein BHM03_00055674 [Ensete ventricosum]